MRLSSLAGKVNQHYLISKSFYFSNSGSTTRLCKLLSFSLVPLTLAITSCGGGSTTPETANPETESNSAYLEEVGSEAMFVSLQKNAYTYVKDDSERIANPTFAPAPEANSGDTADLTTGNFSHTYTVEQNVDEADIVKYDGEHLYIAKTTAFSSCCFNALVEPLPSAIIDSAVMDEPVERGAIRVLKTDPSTANIEAVTEIEISSDEWVQGLYVGDEQLLALSNRRNYAYFGDAWFDIAYWWNEDESFSARQYSTANPAEPELDWKLDIDGALVQSRRIGDTLYLISRYSPHLPGITLYPYLSSQITENQRILDETDDSVFIPKLTLNGVSQPLFDAESCLVEPLPEVDPLLDISPPFNYPVITTVTAVPIDDPGSANSLCYSESSAGIYVSENALYITQPRWLSEGYETVIHKISLDGTNLDYAGSGKVNGALWSGGQNDFRINEYEGHLRLVTTQWQEDESDRSDHFVHILKESDSAQALETVASLPNSESPEEIGKPNEALFGVRFYGDRAFLVTFEQIDPLYVLDLSDPASPRIAGELEIPGVNSFLHPVNEDLLLGLGRDQGEIKLELFDVSDISAPTSLEVLALAGDVDSWSWSEALHNRYAFTYLSGETTDRIAVPTSSYGSIADNWRIKTELHMVELHNKNASPSSAQLVQVGVLDASNNEDYFWSANHRTVLHDDAVYFVSGDKVWSTFWGSTESQGPK